MQSRIPTGSRTYRSILTVLVFCAGAAAWMFSPAGSSTVLAAGQDGPSYGRLPVVGRDWTIIGRLPDGPQRIDREKYRQGEYFSRWEAIHKLVGPQHISRRGQDLLARRGLGKALLQPGAEPHREFDGIDTLSILIIRIGFEANRDTHLTTIDPGGDFVLVPPPDDGQLRVDPPPHNKAFYEAHLEGLSQYYSYQSGGRLHIEGRVLPEGQDDSYKLTDVADYGPGESGSWTMAGLEAIVRDMMIKADEGTAADGSADLSEYDDNHPFTYIIFVHAGSDWQSDINRDSPNDIPTFFVTLGEAVNLPASGGVLSECSIIPETTNQDGYPGSIAAAFYHEFGHALGLVDIYNTTTGLPQVGIWDLMDSGTNLPVVLGQEEDDGSITYITAVGVLPPSLGVWDKWFLGWLEMGEVGPGGGDYVLPAIEVPRQQYALWDHSGDFDLSYPQALRAGVSPREYFLLENRYVPQPDSMSTYTPYNGFAFERDEATGVILYLAGERAGTWTNSGMYDYFMPPGGVLVWHVNNDRIAANLETNTINAEGDGLRILEADGIQDIGVLDSYVLGWYGSWRDPFGEENGFQNIYTDAFPSSRMFDRSWSGLSVTDIRQRSHRSASVMQFSAEIVPLAAGFPWEAPPVDSDLAEPAGGQAGPRSLDINSGTPLVLGGQRLLVFADAPPADWTGSSFPASLFALQEDGTAQWPAPEGRPDGAFLALDGALAGPPVAVAGLAGAETGLVYGTVEGTVGLSTLGAGTVPGGWNRAAADSLVFGPLVCQAEAGPRICVFAAPDSLTMLDAAGTVVPPRFSFGHATGLAGSAYLSQPRFLPGSRRSSLVVFLAGYFLVVDLADYPDLGEEQAYPREVDGTLRTAIMAVGDGARLWLFDDGGCLGTWDLHQDGGIYPGEALPVTVPLVSEPAVADLDGDGRNDLVLLTAERVLGFQDSGVPLRGFPVRFFDLFPLETGTRISGPAAMADLDGDGVNEVFFNTDGGHLVILDATGRLQPATPFLWGDTAGTGFAVGSPWPDAGENVLYLLSAGGYRGAPMGRSWTNGRVSGYRLGRVEANGPATSAWFGPLGGVLRAGPEGEPHHLGPGAPAAREEDLAFAYPNPLRDRFLTIRFYSRGPGEARFEIYNLEGEKVAGESFPVQGDMVIEHRFDCSMASSGVYIGRLLYPGVSGSEIRTMTLAVER